MTETRAPVSLFKAGILCRCPRCGKGKLYKGLLKVTDRCDVCGLDLSAEDSGDGPAFFVMSIVGALVIIMAMWVEVTFHPPHWLHLVLWTPVVIGLSILLLHPAKALLIASQYRHKAGEGGRNTFK
jgi:uncharacterized protein (DUF983 family)